MAHTRFQPDDVLDFWFPDNGHWNEMASHGAFWHERMHGGMDARIISDFTDLTQAAATGLFDIWDETPRGRLALLIALDQFPRSLWRDTPAAYGQDLKACRLALDGIENGDFDQLAPWEQAFFMIAISHCEGPEHLERMIRLDEVSAAIAHRLPEPLKAMGPEFMQQHERVKRVLARFGRHPHRNVILGRISSPEELAYVAAGDFPHLERPKPRAD